MSQFKVGDIVVITHHRLRLCIVGKVLELPPNGVTIDTIYSYDPHNMDSHRPGFWPITLDTLRVERCGPEEAPDVSQFKRGDIVEYHAVDPMYQSFNGHTGIVESVLVNGSGIEEYTISWLTNMGVEVREPERVASGWRATVLRKVTHVEVPNDAV